MRKAIEFVRPFVAPTAVRVMDRGGDGGPILGILDELCPQWCVRMRGDRHAYRHGAVDDGKWPMTRLAEVMAKPYTVVCQVSRNDKLTKIRRRSGGE